MKKLVSVLLVLALCTTCLSTVAFADETEKEVFVEPDGTQPIPKRMIKGF